jgi:hypothetical protein
MSTPYTGRVQFGTAEVTVTIADVDARHWVGEITGVRAGRRFDAGEVTATLLDQPRPGWQGLANVEAMPDGSAQLVGCKRFNPPLRRR